MMGYTYGSHTSDGIHVDSAIQHSLGALDYLVSSLDSRGYQLMSYNREGILVNYKEPVPISPPLPPDPIPIETEPVVIQILDSLVELEGRINSIPLPEEAEKKTGGFYLLYEFLPEHIKKELKIYIKK